jgi:hypothetical protein
MPPEYVATRRVGQRETIEQRVRDRPWVVEVPQARHQHGVLPPAEDVIDGRELSGEADGLPHVRHAWRRRSH